MTAQKVAMAPTLYDSGVSHGGADRGDFGGESRDRVPLTGRKRRTGEAGS